MANYSAHPIMSLVIIKAKDQIRGRPTPIGE
jgi:hypothetical protein